MNSKKYLSALLLVLTLGASQVLNGGRLGSLVDSTLSVPGRVVPSATNVAEKPVDTILDEEEIVEEPMYADESNDVLKEDMLEDEYTSSEPSYDAGITEDDDIENYDYNSYGYADEDSDTMEAETDYDAELE